MILFGYPATGTVSLSVPSLVLKRYWYLRGTWLRDLCPVNTLVELFLRG